ncbi:MAG: recombinase family protein, partial [Rhodospirillaceae bacterium]|nr:recombinase family protein [Rhodospirillaceae bacterium]
MSVPLVSDAPRVAIYARYSSDLQNPRSIDDQIHLCRRRLANDGVPRSRTYTDSAHTATHIHDRAGLRALMADAFSGEIDLICAEALDRISRDLSDVASIWKRLQFHGTELLTVEEGKITTMHVALKGLLNDEFIRNLAAKTRRGQAGRVREGRIPGGLSYGYRMVNRIEDNKMIRGLREIHAEQAAVVRTIFGLYADGLPTRAIAAMLNGQGIPSPRGGQWSSVAINGNRARRNGILNNELYRGQITYNRQRFIRDPDTGKRVPRINPHTEWIVCGVPELRIIDDGLWE